MDIATQLDRIERNTLLAAKDVFTIEDAALYLGLSKSRIYAFTSAKEIPHYKNGGKRVYFDREELKRWALEMRVPTNAEIRELAEKHCFESK